jgi:hypothetical protein
MGDLTAHTRALGRWPSTVEVARCRSSATAVVRELPGETGRHRDSTAASKSRGLESPTDRLVPKTGRFDGESATDAVGSVGDARHETGCGHFVSVEAVGIPAVRWCSCR